MIELNNISKTFKVARRNPGFKEAAKAFFHKEYEYIKALDNISFKISEGEMVGYIGPNGAGKSSTIKIMSGILNPDRGTCVINGRTPWKDRINHVREIGVVFGQRSQLWWDVPVIDSFELLKDIYKIDEREYKKNLNDLVDLLNLGAVVRTPTRQLSLGQRMRCEIAASLLHSPKILFLDEPTIGLDAVSKIAVREFIRHINQERKTTLILTTHDMQDIEALTKRILLIGKGRILLDGDLDSLKKKYVKHKTITVEYRRGKFDIYDKIRLVENTKNRLVVTIDTDEVSVSKALAHLSQSLDIADISVSSPSAEEMVVAMYKEHNI